MWPFSQRIISDEWQRKEKLLVDHQVLSHVSSQDLLLLHSQCSSFILCSLPGLFFIFVIPLCLNSFLLWKLFLFCNKMMRQNRHKNFDPKNFLYLQAPFWQHDIKLLQLSTPIHSEGQSVENMAMCLWLDNFVCLAKDSDVRKGSWRKQWNCDE